MPDYPTQQLPFNPEWQPVANIGDYVALQRGAGSGAEVWMKLLGIFAAPLIDEVDFGAVNAGITSPAAQALVGSADVLQVGPDEFLQIRFQLSPADFQGFLPAQDRYVTVFQPGPAEQHWTTLTAVARWDIVAQNYWTTLHPTELFSYSDETPQFSITNEAGNANMATSLVRFFAWRYLGQRLGNDRPSEEEVRASPSGRVLFIPVSPRRGATARVPLV